MPRNSRSRAPSTPTSESTRTWSSPTTAFELEEAYARTTSLPQGLEVKAGQYLTEFGRINPSHAHAWSFTNQPVIATRARSASTACAASARASPGWRRRRGTGQLIVGAQNTNDEGMDTINGISGGHHHHGGEEEGEETAVAGYALVERETTRSLGDLAWSARLEHFWQVDHLGVQFGLSGATTNNLAGVDTSTLLYGADLTLKWKPGAGRPWVNTTVELIGRSVEADGFTAVGLRPRPTARHRGRDHHRDRCDHAARSRWLRPGRGRLRAALVGRRARRVRHSARRDGASG